MSMNASRNQAVTEKVTVTTTQQSISPQGKLQREMMEKHPVIKKYKQMHKNIIQLNEENVKSIKNLQKIKKRMERHGVKLSPTKDEKKLAKLLEESSALFKEPKTFLQR